MVTPLRNHSRYSVESHNGLSFASMQLFLIVIQYWEQNSKAKLRYAKDNHFKIFIGNCNNKLYISKFETAKHGLETILHFSTIAQFSCRKVGSYCTSGTSEMFLVTWHLNFFFFFYSGSKEEMKLFTKCTRTQRHQEIL